MKAMADAQHSSSRGASGGGGMQAGDHVGRTHVELGLPAGGRQQHAGGGFASGGPAGGHEAAAVAGAGQGLTGAEPRWGDFGSGLDSATTSANSWATAHQQQPQATPLAGSSGSNGSSDDGSSQTAGESGASMPILEAADSCKRLLEHGKLM